MPSSTSDPRRPCRTVLLVQAVTLALALAGYLAHPSLRLASSEVPAPPGRVSSSPAPGGPGTGPAGTTPPAAALTVGTAVEAMASPAVVAAALYDAYAAAVQVVPASCHLPVSLLVAVGQAESGALVDVAAGPAVLGSTAAATARSLCADHRDLARRADLRSALLDRVRSPAFVRLVLTLEARYAAMGLGLLAVAGPALGPLVVAAAAARPMSPYAPVSAVLAFHGTRSAGTARAPARPHQQRPMLAPSAAPTPTLTVAAAPQPPSLTPGVVVPQPAASPAGSEAGPGGDGEAAADPPPAADEPSGDPSTRTPAEAPPDPVDSPAADPTPGCTQTPITELSPSPSEPAPGDPVDARTDAGAMSPAPGSGTDPAAGDCTDGSAAAGPDDPSDVEPTQRPEPVSPPPETVLP